MQKYLYILLFALLSFVQATGQGWERIYGGSGQDVAKALTATPDGGYVLTGYYNGNTRLYLVKVDADGKLQWSKTFTGTFGASRMEGFAVVNTPDNGFAIAGYVDQDGSGPLSRDIYLLKTDAFGNKMWDKTYGGSLIDEARAMIALSDGCFVLTGFQTYANSKENVFILKTDPQGNTLWFNNFGTTGNRKKGLSMALALNGDFVVAGELQPTITNSKDAYMLRVGASGNLIKEQTYEAIGPLGATGDDEARAVVATNDGNFVYAGYSNIGPGGVGTLIKVDGTLSAAPIWQRLYTNTDFYGLTKEAVTGNLFGTGKRTSGILEDLNIIKFSPTGEITWEAVVGRPGLDIGYAVLPTKGGALAAGFSEPSISPTGESNVYLVRTDAAGKVFTSYIQANIFRDFNNNCQPDVDELGLRNWIVRFESQYDKRYAISNGNGDLSIEVDTGEYKMVLFPPNTYWKACDSIVSITVPDFYDTVSVAVPVRSVFDCARNEVDIVTPILRRCSDNIYKVRYCNSGTVPSINTKVRVVLDPMMSYQSSSISVNNILGDTLVFNIGTVPNGECKDFTVTAFLECLGTVAGQAHCVSAYITPNDFCDVSSAWDSAIIVARAYCENDTVKMLLQNVGPGGMNGSLGYIIAEDIVMLTAPNDPNFQFRLDAGQDSVYWTHPANGSTFRIIAQQSPGYPGTSYPTAAVEGCISDTSTIEPSLGFYTMFPEGDADAFYETDCQESQETDYNPDRLKRGHPKGYDVAHHYVSPETDLDYLIQFRNTSADTVRQVIIRDTLSASLDPATVYPGASSHPYLFEMYGNGIVQFTLENANLPPGGGASEGFVKFRVAQKPNLPCETIIFNSAAIYFDFKAPIMSTTTFHTVCEFDSFIIITKTKEIYFPNVQVKTYPNPASEYVNFEITGVDAKQYTLQLYDIQGRLIANLFYDNPMFQLYRHQLPAGTVIYRLAADGKPLAAGKLIVR